MATECNHCKKNKASLRIVSVVIVYGSSHIIDYGCIRYLNRMVIHFCRVDANSWVSALRRVLEKQGALPVRFHSEDTLCIYLDWSLSSHVMLR